MPATAPDIAQAALRLGIAEPNSLQRTVWQCRAERLVIISPTGTGKTLAYGGAMLQRLPAPSRELNAIVIAPTRELVIQIADVLRRLCDGYKVTATYGKHSMRDEKNSIAGCPNIIVGTPGRILDHFNRGHLNAFSISLIVIDEFDKCLEMGFSDEMSRICRYTRRARYAILTSATDIDAMPDFIDMSSAKVIRNKQAADHPACRMEIAQVFSDSPDKLGTLQRLLGDLPDKRVIVFVNYRDAAERVNTFLKEAGFTSSVYNGSLEQDLRERAVICLDNGSVPIMIATDIAARGLDIDSIAAIIHYHIPVSPEAWTHRNGRTARFDASGKVFIITGPQDTLPEYISPDRVFEPSNESQSPMRPAMVTFYINAGRREKISRGDIVGFLTKTTLIPGTDIGKIDLRDHCAYVAVNRRAIPTLAAISQPKIKSQRVRITLLSL